MPTEKALALGSESGAYWQQGERTLEDARTKVLAYCRERTKAECSLAADNFDPINQRTPEAKVDH